MLTVQTIKTWHGRKWAILDEKREIVTWGRVSIGVFPYTKEGYNNAHKFRKDLEEERNKGA